MSGKRLSRRAATWSLVWTGLAVVGLGTARLAQAGDKKPFVKVGATQVWTSDDQPQAFFFMAKMSMDADGAPKAYHMNNAVALDYLGNAGKPGNWFALITDTGEKDGTPIVQGPNDPAPGYYVSATSLVWDSSKGQKDPRRYVDASQIPYIALSPELRGSSGGKATLGDLAAVINPKNGKVKYAVFGDVGSVGHIGEGSVWLGNELQDTPDAHPDAKHGGFDSGIIYVVFPGSGAASGNPRSLAAIDAEGQKLFNAWGGMTHVKDFYP